MSEVLIFLTATINCGQTPHVQRQDPEQRRQDYLEAFRAWMSLNCKVDILFCENSNTDLSGFQGLAGRRTSKNSVRLITFPGNSGAQQKGKGYGELEMLRYAFENIPELKSYRYIIKVSGRYLLRNAVDLVNRVGLMKEDLICDIHANLTYGDTIVAAFKPRIALDYLLPYQEELDEPRGVIIEHLMAKCLHLTLAAGGSWAPLPTTPLCDGVSGTWNTPQRMTLLHRFKQGIKRILSIWIYRY